MLVVQSLVILFIIYHAIALVVYSNKGNKKKVQLYGKSIGWLILVLIILIAIELFIIGFLLPDQADLQIPVNTEVVPPTGEPVDTRSNTVPTIEDSGCLTAAEPGLEAQCYETFLEVYERNQ